MLIDNSPSTAFADPDLHLLVDDVDIARRARLTRRIHPCRKLPEPVLSAEEAWEEDAEDRRLYIYGTVHPNDDSPGFRMWYMRYPNRVLYATSTDGLRWTRPRLDLVEFAGSRANNILPLEFHSPSIVYDPRYPESPYRALGCARSLGKGYYAAHSPDGFRWTLYPHNPALPESDTCTLSLDPSTGDYLAFHKRTHEHRGQKRRLVYLATSPDMQDWSEPILAVAPDEIDDCQTQAEGGLYSQFYNMSAFPCGDQWLGMITHFRYSGLPSTKGPAQSQNDGPIDVQLLHSRDGRTWHRCEDRTPIIPNGPHPYDAGCILGLANHPILVGDEHWHYYTAITTTHGGCLPEKRIAIARAAWRQNGWCSLDAGPEGGVLETTPLSPSGTRLFVNAEVDGKLQVELLDPQGRPLPGYTADACIPTVGDDLDLPIRWRQTDHLPPQKPFALRFHLQNAHLFSYRFV